MTWPADVIRSIAELSKAAMIAAKAYERSADSRTVTVQPSIDAELSGSILYQVMLGEAEDQVEHLKNLFDHSSFGPHMNQYITDTSGVVEVHFECRVPNCGYKATYLYATGAGHEEAHDRAHRKYVTGLLAWPRI